MHRIFTLTLEPKESQVTLSPSLVQHMLRHNRYGRGQLNIIPVKMPDGKIALDVNPPYDVLEEEVQRTMAELQWDEPTRSAGFQMEDPTVTGLLYQYRMMGKYGPDKTAYMLRAEAKRVHGRWIYAILPESDDVDEWMRLDFWERWTQRLQRWKLI